MTFFELLLLLLNLIWNLFVPPTAPIAPPNNAPIVVPIPTPVVVPVPMAPTATTTKSPSSSSTFELGLLQAQPIEGIRLSKGLTAKIIARTGQSVPYTSPNATRSSSTLKFHGLPDGADVFALPDGGYVYTSNVELDGGDGGVYGLEFDKEGRTRNYMTLLSGTSRNCNGGRTPWDTWVSCEEVPGGQCWQVDPTGRRAAEITVLGSTAGGSFEAFAYDVRYRNNTSYYVTEDTQNGALRRYRPAASPSNDTNNTIPLQWDVLHNGGGTIDYLEFVPNSNRFRWTTSLSTGRTSAQNNFPNAEGIAIYNGILHFVSKVKKQLYSLDLDALTYTVVSTRTATLPGGGTFDDQPDHVVASPGTTTNILLTEDGGTTPGMFVYDGTKYLSYFETTNYRNDEIVGIAFSPDYKYLFAAVQDAGLLFQISREDGRSFDTRRTIRV